jgi:RNA methyltransferase, TrmH family
MHITITSTQNTRIKNLLSLEKARERKKQGLFVVEGRKELGLALEAGYRVENIFFCEDLISRDALMILSVPEHLFVPVSKDVFDKIAIRENSGGVLAVLGQKSHGLESIRLSDNPLVLVLESVEKPGNLGAVLRTADAAGLDAVIICDPRTDFYNPNVIRSSVGCLFTNQVASTTSAGALAWLQENNIVPYSTYLKASRPYHTVDYTRPCAIVMGTEATGLSDAWITENQNPIIIPMKGRIDSMNVSTAAAVIIYEALRQRGFS